MIDLLHSLHTRNFLSPCRVRVRRWVLFNRAFDLAPYVDIHPSFYPSHALFLLQLQQSSTLLCIPTTSLKLRARRDVPVDRIVHQNLAAIVFITSIATLPAPTRKVPGRHPDTRPIEFATFDSSPDISDLILCDITTRNLESIVREGRRWQWKYILGRLQHNRIISTSYVVFLLFDYIAWPEPQLRRRSRMPEFETHDVRTELGSLPFIFPADGGGNDLFDSMARLCFTVLTQSFRAASLMSFTLPFLSRIPIVKQHNNTSWHRYSF